jgi:hypothetical protein
MAFALLLYLYIAIIAHPVNRKRKKKRIFFQQLPVRSAEKQPEQLYWLAPGGAAGTKKYPALAGSGNENVSPF